MAMKALAGGGDRQTTRREPLPLEIAFLAEHGVAPASLRQVAEQADRLGVSPARQAIACGLVDETTFYRGLAAELGLRYRHRSPCLRAGGTVAAILREGMAAATARRDSTVRFAAAPPPGPALRRLLAAGLDGRDDLVMLTPSTLAAEVRRVNAAAAGREAAWLDDAGLKRASARTGMSTGQQLLLCLALAFLAVNGALAPVQTLIGFALMLSPLFFAAVVLRLAAAIERPRVSPGAGPWRGDDAALPVYTVAVPIFREETVLDQLIAALAALDYPAAKLDIKILVEEIDWGLRRALAARDLPPFVEVLIVPAGAPQTKPRALNLALAEARGELFTIFDAEDVPDPRQLRMAASRFLRSEPALVCLQARLVIDNPDDGWLSGCFALEYAGLFDVLNPGLLQAGLPIMLGGTSNHFRTTALRDVGGWDPWNVTEDADIGFRLLRAGGYMADLPSATFEEAPQRLNAWLKQRRRWLKGYLQTLIRHLLDPAGLLREAGPGGAATLIVLLAGTLLGTLLYPVFILATAAAIIEGSLFLPRHWLELVCSSFAIGLAASGLCVVFLLPALGAWRRGAIDLWRWLPVLPFYHLLASLAAWLALYDYVDNRFGWHKTAHGLARSSRYRARRARPGRAVTDGAATPALPLPAAVRY